MIEVGVRELKNNLSHYLKRVARGERIRVTMRGRPVAELGPAAANKVDEDLKRLAAEGKLTLATKPKDRNPPPPVRSDSSVSASELISRDREDRL